MSSGASIKKLPVGWDRSPHRGWIVRAFNGQRYQLRKGHHVEACPGEAHSNGHIDNCGLCAPLWGVIAVKDGES